MNTASKVILSVFIASVVFLVATRVNAANTPTPSPIKDTRVECKTGNDGKQVCETVTVERTSSGSAKAASATPTRTPTPTATPSPTRTPTPTVTPKVTGTDATGEAKPGEHKVVNTGLQENIIAVLFGGFMVSAIGYSYAKVRA